MAAGGTPTRAQVPRSTVFNGGEGTWFDAGVVYFTSKGDNGVWAYNTVRASLDLLYDDDLVANGGQGGPILRGVDNVFVSAGSGDVFVAEDGGDMDMVIITPERTVARLLKASGVAHVGSELAGPALSPDGTRFYFSSQRANGFGVTYEITGPFRTLPRRG